MFGGRIRLGGGGDKREFKEIPVEQAMAKYLFFLLLARGIKWWCLHMAVPPLYIYSSPRYDLLWA